MFWEMRLHEACRAAASSRRDGEWRLREKREGLRLLGEEKHVTSRLVLCYFTWRCTLQDTMGARVVEVRWISNGSLLLLRFCICVSSLLVCESFGIPSHHSSVRKPWYHLDKSLSGIVLHLQ